MSTPKLLAFLEGLNDCMSVEAVWEHHLATMQGFGFGKVFYGFTRARTSNSFGAREDILILSNHDPDYLKRFIDDGMYFHAPMVKWAAENVGYCSWSWMSGGVDSMTDTERRILELNHRYGITAGYTISFKDISVRAKGAIGLVSSPEMTQEETEIIWAEHGRVLVQMNNVAHLKLASLPYASPRRKLTDRQREVLEWIGDGKNVADTASIMGVTPATVEKHLRLARESLDVETTAQAVFKASFSNQIFVIEP